MNNDALNSEPRNLKNGQPFKVFIDPLQGCVFEVSVRPKDTVLSVKMKIQELKGLPANQQQLLFNFKELDDTATLEELSVTDQTTLQLVLALRSGPVTTLRKIIPAMSNTFLKDLIIHNRKEIGSLQPGTRLSIMVFRDGTKVKMFRMLEKIDSSTNIDPFIGSSTRSSSGKQLILKSQRSKYHEDPKIVQKVKFIKAKLLEQKNSRKKAVVSNENELPFMNQILNENMAPAKKKLPPLSSTLVIKEESSPRTKVEFSHVPVLPNIGPNTLPSRHASFSQASAVNKLTPGVADKVSINDANISDSQQMCEAKETVSSTIKRRNNLVAQHANLSPDQLTKNESPRFNLELKAPTVLKSEKNLINSQAQDVARKLPLSEERKNSMLGEHVRTGFLSSRNPVPNIETEDFVPAKKLLSVAPAEKKSKSRCSECRKKLTISNMYECRCGLLLCSTHRYSEAHSCSFDYKTEGKKFIKKVNPLVIAPKLPKI